MSTETDNSVVRPRSTNTFLVRFRTSQLEASPQAATAGGGVPGAVTFAPAHPHREPAMQQQLVHS